MTGSAGLLSDPNGDEEEVLPRDANGEEAVVFLLAEPNGDAPVLNLANPPPKEEFMAALSICCPGVDLTAG